MNRVHNPIRKLVDAVRLKHKIFISLLLLILQPYLVSCASSGGSRIHAGLVPPGSDRLAQVVHFSTREQILSLEVIVSSLEASGITKADIQDKSLAMGRVNCCRDLAKDDTAIIFYVPKGLTVQLGDIVEIRSGGDFKHGEVGTPVNVVTRVREKYSDNQKQCHWDPPDDLNLLWLRILYCEWMPQEGWILNKQTFGTKYWIKPSS